MSKLERMTRAEYDEQVRQAANRADIIVGVCGVVGLVIFALLRAHGVI